MDDLAVFWALRRRRMASAMGGAGDTTAPTLTFPNALPLGDTSCYLEATTNEGNGTLYYVVTTSVSNPSAAQVKAGQDHTGAAASYAGSQAVSSTGAKTATGTGLASNTTYYTYFMHEDAVGNQSAVKALTVFTTLTTGTSDTDFDNLIAAASVAPSDLRKGYVARFIGALYAASVWTKIDVMWVLAAHDEQFGRLNWKSPSTFTLTAVNSPTFTTDRGFAGNGSTSYLDTGWDAATNGSQYTRDNAHVMSYARTAGSNSASFGAFNSNNISVVNRTGTPDRGRANAGADVDGVAGGTMPQQIMIRRNVSTDQSILRDGTQIATEANASSALVSGDIAFGLVGSAYHAGQVAGGALGAYLDDTEAAAYYAAWNAYLVALGADT